MHGLTINQDGSAEMAFTGSRDAVWHGLGAELEKGASIETWREAAGMDWLVKSTPVMVNNGGDEPIRFPGKKALYRSDNQQPLSIVGDKYHIVQPGEVLEFFRDLTDIHGFELSTAGTLFGGRRFWALAETGKSFNISEGDEILGHLLLVTSVDGSLSTQAKFVSTRVVCNNTLTVSLNEHTRHLVRVSHKTKFDAEKVKIDLGIIDRSWSTFRDNLTKLANTKVDQADAGCILRGAMFKKDVELDRQGYKVIKQYNAIIEKISNGIGSEETRGTLFGVLNGATEVLTHASRRKDESRKFIDSYEGELDQMKTRIYEHLLEAA